MDLSKLELNLKNRKVQQDLSNVHALHQRIMQGFPDENRDRARADWHVLFRHEPDSAVLLVQSVSDVSPNWQQLPSEYLTNFELKSIDTVLEQLQSGRILQFRLKANPSKRSKETGKTFALTSKEDRLLWLDRQALRSGFEVLEVDLIPVPDIYGRKPKSSASIKIISVLFQGVLRITDIDLFQTALQHGIGRGRTYGCGLLSVAKLSSFA
jgi:CRISPR system Cascade subunit CasE